MTEVTAIERPAVQITPEIRLRNAEHISQLDAVRGVAILMVLFLHITNLIYGAGLKYPFGLTDVAKPSLWRYILIPTTLGWSGVTLFLVLSGFVIHHSTLRSPRPFKTWTFYWRRFWRIYPPYLIALVFFTAYQMRMPSERHQLTIDFVKHAFLIHNLSHQSFFAINPSFWSLAVEVQFYAVYPAVLLLRSKIGVNWLMALAVAIYFTVSQIAPGQMWAGTLMTWFPWMLGAFLAERFHLGKRSLRMPYGIVWLAIPLFLITLAVPRSQLATPILIGLIFAAIIERLLWVKMPSLPGWNLLSLMGICSYSFYLWHQPFLGMISGWLRLQRISSLPARYLLMCAIMLLIFFPISYVLYLTIEKPSHWLAKRKR